MRLALSFSPDEDAGGKHIALLVAPDDAGGKHVALLVAPDDAVGVGGGSGDGAVRRQSRGNAAEDAALRKLEAAESFQENKSGNRRSEDDRQMEDFRQIVNPTSSTKTARRRRKRLHHRRRRRRGLLRATLERIFKEHTVETTHGLFHRETQFRA